MNNSSLKIKDVKFIYQNILRYIRIYFKIFIIILNDIYDITTNISGDVS